MPSEIQPTVAAADRMTDAVKGLGTRLDALRTDTLQLRTFIKIMAVSIIFDVCLSVAAFGFGYRINTVANEAHAATTGQQAIHTNAVNQCLSGNDFRTKDLERWNQLLNLTPIPTDAAGLIFRQNIIAVNNAADALRDCSLIK